MEHEIKQNVIILNDRGKEIKLTLDNYVKEFYKVLIFLTTFYLVSLKTNLDMSVEGEELKNQFLSNVEKLLESLISSSYDSLFLDIIKEK